MSATTKTTTVGKDAKKGGRKGWTTAQQETWLCEQIGDYHMGQGCGGRKLMNFWGPVFEGWFQQWPESAEGVTEGSSMHMEAIDAKKKVRHSSYKCPEAYRLVSEYQTMV